MIFKIAVVIIFLVMFLRRPSLPWGVGLLTVSSALLLDTILGTFNEELLRAELGFFYYVIIGFLLGGALFWLLSLLRPVLNREPAQEPAPAVAASQNSDPFLPSFGQVTDESAITYDLQLIYDDLVNKFDHEDRLDVMFDLNIPESALLRNGQSEAEMAAEIITYAQKQEQAAQLALAVERILTPPAPETLPRLEKITPTSPRPILRYYMLAHFDLAQLQEMAVDLGINWEQIDGVNHRSKTRELLRYLYENGRIPELLSHLQSAKSYS